MRSILILKQAKKAKQKAKSIGKTTEEVGENEVVDDSSGENSSVLSNLLCKIKKAWDGE